MNGQIVIGNVDWMRNDYVSDISFGGVTYPTLEHAFQAAKFSDFDVKEEISEAETVKEARSIGRERTDLRPDWEESKFKVMEFLVRLKFTQSNELARRLAMTGSAEIIMEGYDSYWGTGRDGDGQNQLGCIMEEIRDEVQAITGITENDIDEDEDDLEISGPLKAALSDSPTEDLIDACQQLYDGAHSLMTLVDANDFDAGLISRQTGVSLDTARDSINKLQKMQAALSYISDTLGDDAIKIFPKENDDESDPLDQTGDNWFDFS